MAPSTGPDFPLHFPMVSEPADSPFPSPRRTSILLGVAPRHEMRRSRSGPLHSWSARSRLVEHSNPAHANPTAQVPAARRDDRPATRRRTTGRKHRFIDRIRAPHNRYIATPINARNGRPEELDRGYSAAAGITTAAALRGHGNGGGPAAPLERRRTDACAPHRRDGGPTPARPKGRRRAQCTAKRLSLIQLYNSLYLFFICSCYANFLKSWGLVCAVHARA